MQFPTEVYRVVEKVVEDNHNSITDAINEATQAVKKLAVYPEIVDNLIASAIQGLVYDARHKSTVATKREARKYGQPQKAGQAATSTAVKHVYRSFFTTFFIGGYALGSLTPELMETIERDERASATGHTINAELVSWLKSKVPAGKTVSESMREHVVRAKYTEIEKRIKGE